MSGVPRVLLVDSGIGGLSVAEEVRKALPGADLAYVADYALFPYGLRSEAEILAHLPSVFERAVRQVEPHIAVLACNTASTIALPAIRARLSIPVVGTVPAIKPAAAFSRSRAIGLLGTPGTVRRRYTDELIARFASDCTVVRHGSSALVRLAEEKLAEGAVDAAIVGRELSTLLAQPGGDRVDSVVLACTHFPFLRPELEAAAPRPLAFIDSGEAIARRVAALLAEGPNMGGVIAPLSTEKGMAFVTAPWPSTKDPSLVFSRFGFRAPVVL